MFVILNDTIKYKIVFLVGCYEEDLCGVYAKCQGAVGRVAGILHVLNWAAKNGEEDALKEIQKETMDMAVTLMK
jgi:hypothetical protein